MKKITMALLLGAATVFATDYGTMTTEELKTMRGSVPEADRSAYQTEMQNRVQVMSTEEKQAMQKDMKQSQSGSTGGSGSQMQKGGGQGGMSGGGQGGMGGGKQFRGQR